jgi:hypothetical protein
MTIFVVCDQGCFIFGTISIASWNRRPDAAPDLRARNTGAALRYDQDLPVIADASSEVGCWRSSAELRGRSAIPSFFETKESSGVQNRSEKNRIVVF